MHNGTFYDRTKYVKISVKYAVPAMGCIPFPIAANSGSLSPFAPPPTSPRRLATSFTAKQNNSVGQ